MGNMISFIGVVFMVFGMIVFLFNVIKMIVLKEKVGCDLWDVCILEWIMLVLILEYNFK